MQHAGKFIGWILAVATCSYGFEELVSRITRLSSNTSLPNTVETAEKAFGIPRMTTSYDDERIASYSTILSGKDGWRMLLWVREAFYPLNKGPKRFEPGLRPKRLYSVADADLRIDLIVLGQPPALGTVQCAPVSPLIDALAAAGWQDIEMQYLPPTDGGPRTPILGHGTKRVGILGFRGNCAQNIALMQNEASD